MKLIICMVFFLAVNAAPENDDKITCEKIKEVFTNLLLLRGKAPPVENRTETQWDNRVLSMKKENVDVTIVMKERKLYSRKIAMDTKCELNGNKFFVNASMIYMDVQDDGTIEVNGTVNQKQMRETGKLTINWELMRESEIVKKAEFNETHMTILKLVVENQWSVPKIKISGVEELSKHVTNEDFIRAVDQQMSRKRLMQQDSYDKEKAETFTKAKFLSRYRFYTSKPEMTDQQQEQA